MRTLVKSEVMKRGFVFVLTSLFILVCVSAKTVNSAENPNLSKHRGVALTPEGEPAKNAIIIATQINEFIFLSPDNIGYYENKPMRTISDEEGKFAVYVDDIGSPSDPFPYGFFVFHESGFAQVIGSDFDKNNNLVTNPDAAPIKLEKYCDVEGELRIGQTVGAGKTVLLELQKPRNDKSTNSYILRYYIKICTDEAGKFAVKNIPPGKYRTQFYQDIPGVTYKNGEQIISYTYFPLSTVIVLKPGEKKEIKLGGTGRPVIGKFTDPDNLACYPEIDTETGKEIIKTAFGRGGKEVVIRHPVTIPFPVEPEKPKELTNLPQSKTSLSPEDEKKYDAFYASDIGKKYLEDMKTYRTEFTKAKEANSVTDNNSAFYRGIIQKDGSFRIEDVSSGKWLVGFSAHAPVQDARVIIRGETEFTIPEMPEGRSDEPFDVGEIPLKMGVSY
ncbi:MAG: hypothetical protein ACRC2T_06145 [Thermoguttaceae bacterium]